MTFVDNHAAKQNYKRYWRAEKNLWLEFYSAKLEMHDDRQHVHRGVTISAIDSGNMKLVSKFGSIEHDLNEIIVCGSNAPHNYNLASFDGGCHLRSVIMEERGAAKFLPSTGSENGSMIAKFYSSELHHEFIYTHRKMEENPTADCGMILSLISEIIKISRENVVFDYKIKSDYVKTVKAYIENFYMERPSLSHLASLVNLNEKYLVKIFKEELNISPSSYVNVLCVKKAQEIMLNEGRSISEIASSLGFFDQSHFSKTFARITGVPPHAYVKGAEYNLLG